MSDAIGFIGLGLMGKPIAVRLRDAQLPVMVWNRSAEKIHGFNSAASPADLCQQVDIVCLCLADGAAVEEVVFGGLGLSNVQGQGKLVVDFSSISPELTRQLAARLKDANGMEWIDAPVSGGVSGAEKGELVIMCGGKESTIARAEQVFKHVALKVTAMGGLGAGQTAKYCNQLIVASATVAIAEAFTFARMNSVDCEKLLQALTGGFADSKPFQLFGKGMAAGVFEPRTGKISTMEKDIAAVVEAARATGDTLLLAETTAGIYKNVMAAGFGELDISALSACIEGIKNS